MSLPIFDPATPKVSILAIGMQTLASANELVAEAGQQAAKFQVQATDKAEFMQKAYASASTAVGVEAVNSCHARTCIRTHSESPPLRVPTCACDDAIL